MLSILIVNYNSAHHILELIDSLRKSSIKNFKIVVVDNASTDDSIDILKHLKTIKLIQNEKNMGFAAAINQGIKIIKTKYTLILNPDIIVEENTIKNLIDLAENKHADFVGGVIYDYKTKKHYSSGGRINMLIGIASSIKITEPRELEENEYFDACVYLAKTESFKDLMYDEKYFMYGETLDFITRARNQAIRIFVNSDAIVYHKLYGSSEGKKTSQIVYYLTRNRFLYMKKFSKYYILFLLIQIPIFIIQVLKYLITKPWLLPSLIKGYFNGIFINR